MLKGTFKETKHEPVMVREVIESLHIKNQGRYIDATLGAGGYSIEIVKKGGIVLGIDTDPKMLEIAENNLMEACPASEYTQKPYKLTLGNFRNIDRIARENEFTDISGIVFDLGISNIHFLGDDRGFSFNNSEASLDMRLSPETQSVKASDLLNTLREDQLIAMMNPITGFIEARSVARAVIKTRSEKRIETVGDLLNCLSFIKKTGKTHPLTKVFLALRMAVNSELESLEEALGKAVSILNSGGRLVVVTFHSLEQQIVTRFLKKSQKEGILSIETEKPAEPSETEISSNPKSRSALLNVSIKK